MVSYHSSNNIPQLLIDLILLFKDTTELCVKLDLKGRRIIEDLTQELPDHFGELICNFGILDNFITLGKTVRNFHDAKEVLTALYPVMLKKLQYISEEQILSHFYALEKLCYEAGRRSAIYEGIRIYRYPDDFLPGQIYSNN